MPRDARREDALLRVHIQLYERDWQRLLSFYGGKVKRSSVVRELVHSWVKKIEAKAEQASARGTPLDPSGDGSFRGPDGA
jgi:hypothetical protein